METAVMHASSRSKMAEVVEKFESERRKATKAVVLQEKVFEEAFVLPLIWKNRENGEK